VAMRGILAPVASSAKAAARTAKALGLKLSSDLLSLANEVIE
jgi:hypothetical protein